MPNINYTPENFRDDPWHRTYISTRPGNQRPSAMLSLDDLAPAPNRAQHAAAAPFQIQPAPPRRSNRPRPPVSTPVAETYLPSGTARSASPALSASTCPSTISARTGCGGWFSTNRALKVSAILLGAALLITGVTVPTALALNKKHAVPSAPGDAPATSSVATFSASPTIATTSVATTPSASTPGISNSPTTIATAQPTTLITVIGTQPITIVSTVPAPTTQPGSVPATQPTTAPTIVPTTQPAPTTQPSASPTTAPSPSPTQGNSGPLASGAYKVGAPDLDIHDSTSGVPGFSCSSAIAPFFKDAGSWSFTSTSNGGYTFTGADGAAGTLNTGANSQAFTANLGTQKGSFTAPGSTVACSFSAAGTMSVNTHDNAFNGTLHYALSSNGVGCPLIVSQGGVQCEWDFSGTLNA